MKNTSLFAILCCMCLVACQPHPQKESLSSLIEQGLNVATEQALKMAQELENQKNVLPKSIKEGKLETCNPHWWTSGFFPGELWYLYEHTNHPELKRYAELFTIRLEEIKHCTTHHDVGFMLHCSYGNGYRLTQNPAYKETLITGAYSLATRYRDHIGLIRSWDFNRQLWQYPVIIDNMMNLEFLMWAGKTTGDKRFHQIAISHADNTIKHHFRPDYSTYHVVSYDTVSGKPHIKQTHQGLSNESDWARGQAWALYGYTMMYRETSKAEYLDQAQHIAAFLMNHPNMPSDKIPYWDLDAPAKAETPRDASAAAIMASALIELGELSGKEERKTYVDYAEQLIRTLTSTDYLAISGSNCYFTLMHSTGNLPGNSEIDVPLSYADYYYVEALLRMKKHLEKTK